MSLPNPHPAISIDLEQLVVDVNESLRWNCLRYLGRVRWDELDDLSQEIVLKLIEDGCRRLRLFDHSFLLKTWLKAVIDHHVYKYLYRRKQAESLDEVDQGALIYAPPQDQDIYASEKREMLFRALGKLSERERLLYQLCFVSELAPAEIAAVFGIEVKAVYKRKQTLVLKLTRLVQTSRNP